jgi:hypothetical protein
VQNQHIFQKKFFTIDLLPTALSTSSTMLSDALDAVKTGLTPGIQDWRAQQPAQTP